MAVTFPDDVFWGGFSGAVSFWAHEDGQRWGEELRISRLRDGEKKGERSEPVAVKERKGK